MFLLISFCKDKLIICNQIILTVTTTKYGANKIYLIDRTVNSPTIISTHSFCTLWQYWRENTQCDNPALNR